MPLTSAQQRSELRDILFQDGIRAALIFLNHLTDHRFTALYRFDRHMLKNLYFYDRENPEELSTDEIPVMASYCVFVRDLRKKFITPNAPLDERVTDHPKQQQVQSYCGVPLVNRFGEMFGTICHFNLQPMEFNNANVDLMEIMSGLLQEWDNEHRNFPVIEQA